MIKWRLIPFLCAPGRVQMAIDSWLLHQHSQHLHPPTLRFYSWESATISLGYHQHKYPASWHDLTWRDRPLELVKRPTGGRAVLHQGDLTYTVITSGLPGNLTEVYQYICQFLIAGWQNLGINLTYGNVTHFDQQKANCFSVATKADLVFYNENSGNLPIKFIGSAQLRKNQAILQHGSMRLAPDPELFKLVFDETIDLANFPSILRAEGLQEKAIECLITAASHCFNIVLEPQPLSDREWAEINTLISRKPSN